MLIEFTRGEYDSMLKAIECESFILRVIDRITMHDIQQRVDRFFLNQLENRIEYFVYVDARNDSIVGGLQSQLDDLEISKNVHLL